MSTAYLTGASNRHTRAIAHEVGLGLLVQPNNGYRRHLADYPVWAADNGCFSEATSQAFDADFDGALSTFLAWLSEMVEAAGGPDRCLFANAPDKLDWHTDENGRRFPIGDAAETLRRAEVALPLIRALGVPAALVAQDGLENLEVPWDSFDVLFLGGSTEWKLSEGARQLVAEAKRRGKRVHMGRVNSRKRYGIAAGWGCDTVDGTYLAFGPEKNLPKLLGWVAEFGGDDEPTRGIVAGATTVENENEGSAPAVELAPAPQVTTTGPVCGRCSHFAGGRRRQVRHASTAEVRACHAGLGAVA